MDMSQFNAAEQATLAKAIEAKQVRCFQDRRSSSSVSLLPDVLSNRHCVIICLLVKIAAAWAIAVHCRAH